MNTRGDVLRAQLEEAGVTQHELSRLTGVPQGRISAYANNKVGLSDGMLSHLLAPLGLTVRHRWEVSPVELTYHERVSWELHKALSKNLNSARFQEWLPKLLSNIKRQREGTRGEPHASNIERWQSLISGRDVPGLRKALVDPGRYGVEMREVTPFIGLLPQDERLRILERIKR